MSYIDPNIAWFRQKCRAAACKMFFSSVSPEMLRIRKANSYLNSFIGFLLAKY